MGREYSIARRVQEVLEASDPLKYGDAHRVGAIELGPSPQVVADPRLAALAEAVPIAPLPPPPAGAPAAAGRVPGVPPPVNVPPPTNAPPTRVPPPATAAPPPPEAATGQAEVVALVREGKPIAAIKRYRELTGAGLVEAKAAVEALANRLGQGQAPPPAPPLAPPPPRPVAPAPASAEDALAARPGTRERVEALVGRGDRAGAIRAYREGSGASQGEAVAAIDAIEARLRGQAPQVPEWLRPVVAELRGGNKIAAIKAYRQATGVGLAEAKATVEGLARQLGL